MTKTFDNLAREASDATIPTANGVLMQDATDTPQKSPLAITTSVTTLAIPDNAAEIVLKASADIRIGADADLSDGYFVVGANETITVGCAKTSALYVRGDAGSATLNFFFNVV